jgi:hypothetical protein
MKRRIAPALITTILLGVLAAQASARPHGSSLSVASGTAAIDRLAGKLTYELATVHSATPMSRQVSACRKNGSGVVCTGEWIFAGETCTVRMEATSPSARVRELGKLECSRQSSAESNGPAAT